MKKQLLILIISVFTISLASAEFIACFDLGDKIDFCNPRTPDRTCSSSTGCSFCMNSYNFTKSCFNQGNFNACNSIPQVCTDITNSSIDQKAPNITVYSPIQDNIYTSLSVLLGTTSSEKADIFYTDNIKSPDRITRLCRDCSSFSGKKSFSEGHNEITIRAADEENNTSYHNVSFLIDTKKPRILSTFPRARFTNGSFFALIREVNPTSLKIFYGNGTKNLSSPVNLEQCIPNRDKLLCNIFVDLSQFNNQAIKYSFNLTDIVNGSHSIREIKLKVDTVKPEVTFFNYSVSERRLSINMSVTEQNFESIKYYDKNSSIPSWKTLCSALKSDFCARTITLSSGFHDIEIAAIDEAGNSDSEIISFIAV